MVSVDNVMSAFDLFVNNKLLSKGTLVQRGVSTFLYLQYKDKIHNYLVLLSDNGSFNVDMLSNNLRKAFETMGNKYNIPLINYTFDVDDLEYIISEIKNEDR